MAANSNIEASILDDETFMEIIRKYPPIYDKSCERVSRSKSEEELLEKSI